MSEVVILHGAVVFVTGIAAWTDLRTGQIPNWLTLPAIAIALIAHFVTGGAAGALYSVIGLASKGSRDSSLGRRSTTTPPLRKPPRMNRSSTRGSSPPSAPSSGQGSRSRRSSSPSSSPRSTRFS